MKILLIDNYDSFTYNLFHLLAEVSGVEPVVVANDRVDPGSIAGQGYSHIVISPGPGRPEKRRDFGRCAEILATSTLPLLGVCLGFQGLVHGCGGKVIVAPEAIHGQERDILHRGDPLFRGLPRRFSAVRYHSLTVTEPMPPCLETIAQSADGLPMAVRHRQKPQVGLQFHPESIGTEGGRQLIANFLKQTPPSAGTIRFVGRPASVASPGPLQAHYRKLACFFDPERVFAALFAGKSPSFWLDSSQAEAGSARFSYMGSGEGPHAFAITYRTGTGELMVARHGERLCQRGDIWDFLARELGEKACHAPDLPCDFIGGLVGYLGYELKAECGGEQTHRSPHPDASFMFVDRFLALDHRDRCLYLVALAEPHESVAVVEWFDFIEAALADLPSLSPPEEQPVSWRLARSRATYLADIQACLQAIHAGESYEVCLTNQLKAEPVSSAFDLYRTLRQTNPAPYAAWLCLEDVSVLCSSPERFLRLDGEGVLISKPIKGTRARHVQTSFDEALRQELATSVKDRSENLMIVDLVRNDLGRVCQIGSVTVPRLMAVESYATVHQLVSTVRGWLRPDRTPVDAIRAAFPGGSMTGAPKRRTMEIIDSLETEARGIYSGSLGYLSLNGRFDLNIVIRTIISDHKGLAAGIGGAIVALSEPEREYEEILWKGEPLMRATGADGVPTGHRPG